MRMRKERGRKRKKKEAEERRHTGETMVTSTCALLLFCFDNTKYGCTNEQRDRYRGRWIDIQMDRWLDKPALIIEEGGMVF